MFCLLSGEIYLSLGISVSFSTVFNFLEALFVTSLAILMPIKSPVAYTAS